MAEQKRAEEPSDRSLSPAARMVAVRAARAQQATQVAPAETAAEAPRCAYLHAHPALVEQVQQQVPSPELLQRLAEFYKVFGDGTRLKLLFVLFAAPMCVCDMAKLLGMSVSAVSHQLRELSKARLVTFRRAGKSVIYSLCDDHVRHILDQGMEHISEPTT